MRSPRTATKSSPCSPQLAKARVQQRRPNAAKNKLIKKKKKKGAHEMGDSRNSHLGKHHLSQLPIPLLTLTLSYNF